ncbi:metal-dependent hydrolase, partial [Mycobacterium tuberculosis]|nr:metal-dependent hydrolase [Mycobacterium tuberculosis]
ADLLDAALREGADLVGGLDPVQYDRDPVRHLDIVFGLAEKHGKGVDIHLHEGGTAGVYSFEEIAHRTTALGLQGKVTISH